MLNNKKNDKILNEEINKLKNELMKANKIIEQQNKKIKELENKLKFNNKSLENEIKLKDKQIYELNQKLKNINPNNIIIDRNLIQCVYFTSIDQKINYPIPCISTDIFAEVEEKLYKEYPEYRETNNYFISQGKEILRFKSISDNNIGIGIPVLLYVSQK